MKIKWTINRDTFYTVQQPFDKYGDESNASTKGAMLCVCVCKQKEVCN